MLEGRCVVQSTITKYEEQKDGEPVFIEACSHAYLIPLLAIEHTRIDELLPCSLPLFYYH